MADIAFICSNCEQKIEAPEEMAGLQVECPSCQRELLIPTQKRMLTLCPLCDGRLTFRQEKLGKLMKCPHCQGAIEVGSATALPQPPPISPPPVPQPTWKPPQQNADLTQRFEQWIADILRGFIGKAKSTATNEELQTFIQSNSYYYIPKWQSFDETLSQKSLGVFNWSACLFTLFWMAYRKMYLYTAILWVFFAAIFTVADMAIGGQAGNYAWFGVMFMFGRFGNSIYKNDAERKIRQIKKEVPPEYHEQALKAEGGTNWLATIPLIILQLLTYYGIYLLAVQKAQQGLPHFN